MGTMDTITWPPYTQDAVDCTPAGKLIARAADWRWWCNGLPDTIDPLQEAVDREVLLLLCHSKL